MEYRPRSTKTTDVPADAPPASLNWTDFIRVSAPVHRAELAPRAGLGDRHAAGPRPAHGGRGPAGHGAGAGTPVRALPSGAQSGVLVRSTGVADPAGVVDGAAAARLADPGGGRRDPGAAQGRAHCRQGNVPRCGPLKQKSRGDLSGSALDLHGVDRPPAVEPAALGIAIPDLAGAVATGQRRRGQGPSDRDRLDRRDGPVGGARAHAPPLGPGRRRQLFPACAWAGNASARRRP